MNKELKKILYQYLEVANDTCSMMIKELNLKDKDELIIYKEKKPKGEFDFNGVRYSYITHGRGCRVTNNVLIIDWDFGYDDIMCGINPFLVSSYILENNIKTEYIFDYLDIKKECEKAVLNNEMICKYDLYYFK